MPGPGGSPLVCPEHVDRRFEVTGGGTNRGGHASIPRSFEFVRQIGRLEDVDVDGGTAGIQEQAG
jgi:hypothetical protein